MRYVDIPCVAICVRMRISFVKTPYFPRALSQKSHVFSGPVPGKRPANLREHCVHMSGWKRELSWPLWQRTSACIFSAKASYFSRALYQKSPLPFFVGRVHKRDLRALQKNSTYAQKFAGLFWERALQKDSRAPYHLHNITKYMTVLAGLFCERALQKMVKGSFGKGSFGNKIHVYFDSRAPYHFFCRARSQKRPANFRAYLLMIKKDVCACAGVAADLFECIFFLKRTILVRFLPENTLMF